MSKNNLVFGINPIQQLLEHNPSKVIEIFINIDKNDKRMQSLVAMAQANNISIQKIDVKKLDKLCDAQNHQGIAAKIVATTYMSESELLNLVANTANPLLLILDGVQDPHNLGACLRAADGAGVVAVVTPRDNAAGITPIVRKVASGAAETVPLVQVTNLARFMQDLQKTGMWIVGTAGDSQQSIYDVDLSGSIAIVLGAEGVGMRQLTTKHCDFLTKLPMLGQVESLNVSVAAGVCLYEAVRQRLHK